MMLNSLPSWARAALHTYAPLPGFREKNPDPKAVTRHQLLCIRAEKDWSSWSAPFLKCVAHLSETGKQIVFEQALWVAKYNRLNFGRLARDEMQAISALHDKITQAADELARLLGERDDLVSKGNVTDDMPDLEGLIEEAASLYPDWEAVASNHMRRFLVNARTQSRPGPTPLDFVMGLSRSYEARYSVHMADITGRNAGHTDIARLMIKATSRINHPEVPARFSLSNPAIAALCNALYDVDDFSDVQIKSMCARGRGAR